MNVQDQYKHLQPEEIKQQLDLSRMPVSVAMVNLSGDFNFSTVVRNCNAFNCQQVIQVAPSKRWDRRGAVGTHHYIDVLHYTTFDELVWAFGESHTVVGVENNTDFFESITQPLQTFHWVPNRKYLLVFGAENSGLSNDMLSECDVILEIPQYGSVRSINVGTTTGIVLYDYMSKVRK